MEQDRTPDFYQFWDELMTERLKFKVRKTYDKETLLTLEDSGKYHGRQLRSSYREKGTFSGKRSNNTLCSDQIPPAEAKKIKAVEGNSNARIDSDDVIEITEAVYQQHTNKSQEIQKEGSDSISLAEVEESEVIEADANIEVNVYQSTNKNQEIRKESDPVSSAKAEKIKAPEGNVNVENNDDNVKEMTPIVYQQFTEKYRRIPKENKWTLSTEKVVEDALYSFGMKCTHEHLCHSFVIDPNDYNYIQNGIFTYEELEEIKNFSKKELPLMPDELLKFLNNFRKSNTSDLRELIFRSDLRDLPFDRSKDFDYDWICNTVYNLVLEYEANHFSKNHLEAWITLHVWSFIDKAFLDIDGMEITRGESGSYASSNRKNSQRTVASTSSMKRKAMGRRGDLVIRKWHTEYGCSEVGNLFKGINGTKIMKEGGLKMPKMLKDMFNNLCEAMEMREDKIRKLETIGFIISGLRISLLRLDLPAGHVCRLSRTRLFEIPAHVSEFGAKVLPTISLVWKAKAIVKNVIKLTEEDDLTEKEQLELLQNFDIGDKNGYRTPPPRLQLLTSSPTPESKRKNKDNLK